MFRELTLLPRNGRPVVSIAYLRRLQQRGKPAADQYARTTVRKALLWVAENPPIRDQYEARLRLVEVEQAARRVAWGEGLGSMSKRVLFGFMVAANRLGSVRFALSWRAWAEESGVSMSRVRDAMRRRIGPEGWVVRDYRDRPGRTARWAIHAGSPVRTFTSLPRSNVWGATTGIARPPFDAILRHDAWTALGDDTWHAFDALMERDGSATHDDLARATGMRSFVLWMALEDLRSHRVIEDQRGCLIVADEPLARLDVVAVELGTAGALERMRERHREEREAFRARGDVNVRSGDAT